MYKNKKIKGGSIMTPFDPNRGNFKDPSSYDSQQMGGPNQTRPNEEQEDVQKSSSLSGRKITVGNPAGRLKTLPSQTFASMTPAGQTATMRAYFDIISSLESFQGELYAKGANNELISHIFNPVERKKLSPEKQVQWQQNIANICKDPSKFIGVHAAKNNTIYHAPNAPASHVQQIKNKNPTATVVQVSQQEWVGFCTALTESHKSAQPEEKKGSARQQERTLSQGETAQPRSSSAVQEAAKKEKAEKERAANKESMAAAQKAGQGSFSELKKMEEKERAKNYVTEERDQKRSEIRKERDL